jgi:hypothetical protein
VGTPGAIAVAGPRISLEQERESDEENILEDVEMQETTEVPPSVVQSNLVAALSVSSEKEEADAVVETRTGPGDSAIVAAIVVSTMVSSKTILISSISLETSRNKSLVCMTY